MNFGLAKHLKPLDQFFLSQLKGPAPTASPQSGALATKGDT